MEDRRGFELTELLAVKVLAAGVWLVMRGGHELATASMLDEALAVIKEVGPDARVEEHVAAGRRMGPPLPPARGRRTDPPFVREIARNPMSQGFEIAEIVGPMPLPALVGTFPLHGD